MKKTLILITLVLFTVSCKNSEEKKEGEITKPEVVKPSTNKGDKIYKGDFLYVADAAVLKGKDFVYSVEINEKMHELANKVKLVKKSDFNMVPVVVLGILRPKPPEEEGWDKVLTITEIVEIGTEPTKEDVRIDNKNK